MSAPLSDAARKEMGMRVAEALERNLEQLERRLQALSDLASDRAKTVVLGVGLLGLGCLALALYRLVKSDEVHHTVHHYWHSGPPPAP